MDGEVRLFYQTSLGQMFLGNSLDLLRGHVADGTVDLIMTSPPFGLVRKKEYGNADADEYLAWFKPFGHEFKRTLKGTGSLVIDIGGSWVPGWPTRSLYHYKLLIMLCEECGFHLAQDFFWWNPSKLPTPAEWVNVRRVRVKDAVNCVWWLSVTPWPKASNKRVLQPYSESMMELLRNGYRAKLRPSGHDISTKFAVDNRGAIPPNLLAIANTESNSFYLRYCQEKGVKPNPARFPAQLPEFFLRMLTDPGDLVIDPFAGSCVTGEVCERLGRRWVCGELVEEYLQGALGRFENPAMQRPTYDKVSDTYYRVAKPDVAWGNDQEEPLDPSGGRRRPPSRPLAKPSPPVAPPVARGPDSQAGRVRPPQAQTLRMFEGSEPYQDDQEPGEDGADQEEEPG